MTSAVGHRFAMLLFRALDHPDVVNRNDLLDAASALLDVAPGKDTASSRLARRMAFHACNWAVFGTAESYAALHRASACFRMHVAIN